MPSSIQGFGKHLMFGSPQGRATYSRLCKVLSGKAREAEHDLADY